MINEENLKSFKRCAYLIDIASGKLCGCDAIVNALESGRLAGVGAHSYNKVNATGGSGEVVKFKED